MYMYVSSELTYCTIFLPKNCFYFRTCKIIYNNNKEKKNTIHIIILFVFLKLYYQWLSSFEGLF